VRTVAQIHRDISECESRLLTALRDMEDVQARISALRIARRELNRELSERWVKCSRSGCPCSDKLD
jgi:hypothetical protein